MSVKMLPRIAACVCVFLALVGCQGTTDIERVGQLFGTEFQRIGGTVEVPRETVAAVPYATLGVQLGSSDQAMFVMQSKSGSDLQWVDKTHYAITTRDGRIMRTAGFEYNLNGVQTDASPSVGAIRVYRYDLKDLNAYGVNPESGFVWRSVQNVHPELDPITVVTFRPAA
jgi:hypothetical protein